MKRLHTYIPLLNKKNNNNIFVDNYKFYRITIDSGPFYSVINYRKDGIYE